MLTLLTRLARLEEARPSKHPAFIVIEPKSLTEVDNQSIFATLEEAKLRWPDLPKTVKIYSGIDPSLI